MDEVPIIVGQGDMTATAPVTSEQNLAGRARCPRCGYDLRGAIGTWADRCPLQGVCAECGLRFVWAEVLHPEKFEPQWCVEFAPRWRQVLRAYFRTFIRSFWPLGFWRELKMSMPIRWRRVFAYMTFLLMPILIGYTAVQTIAAVRVRYDIQQELEQAQTELQQTMSLFQRSLAEMIDSNKRFAQGLSESLDELGSSATPDEQTDIIIAQLETWLKAIEESGGIDAWAEQEARAEYQQFQVLANLTAGVDLSYLDVVAEAVFMPWNDSSAGTITGPQGGVGPYPAPRDLHFEFISRFVDRYPSSFQEHAAFATLTATGLGIWVWLLFPFTFVLLPMSRRKAKVRWGHVLRVTCYAAFIPSVILTGLLIALGIGYTFDGLRPGAFGAIQLIGRYAMIPTLIIWWATAIKRYLHIPHSWPVAVSLTSMLCLVFLALLWALFPDFLVGLS